MNATAEAPKRFQSRYEEELQRLDMKGAQLMFEFIELMLKAGQMPPPEAVQWYAETLVYRVCYYEEYILDQGSRLPKAEYEKRWGQLQDVVARASAAFALLSAQKMFVAVNDLQSILRVRKLYLPQDFDSTYGKLLP